MPQPIAVILVCALFVNYRHKLEHVVSSSGIGDDEAALSAYRRADHAARSSVFWISNGLRNNSPRRIFFTHLLFPSQETRHHDHLSRRRPLFVFPQESNTVDRVHLDIKDGDANVRV